MKIITNILILFFYASYNILLSQGLIFNKEKYKKVEKWEGNKMGFSQNIQDKISLKPFCPIVGDQGNESTCVGWSVAYGALSTQLNIQMGITDIYHKWARAFDPNFVYSFLRNKNDRWCELGTNTIDALTILQQYGCKPIVWAPWLKCNDNTIKSDTSQFKISMQYSIENFYRLNNNDIINDVKYAIFDSLPVIIGMGLTNSSNSKISVKDGKWNLGNIDSVNSGHAMCVIGFDDNKFGGAFEILNSWGETFGEQGYIWISYSDFEKFIGEAFVMKTTYYKKGDCSFGNCKDSYSRYKYKNGDIYEGFMKNGQPDNYGCMLYKDGSLYVGGWIEGKKNGYGILFDQKSNMFYNTIFKNGEIISTEEKVFGFTESENNQAKANIDELLNLLPKSVKIEKNPKIINKYLSKYED